MVIASVASVQERLKRLVRIVLLEVVERSGGVTVSACDTASGEKGALNGSVHTLAASLASLQSMQVFACVASLSNRC